MQGQQQVVTNDRFALAVAILALVIGCIAVVKLDDITDDLQADVAQGVQAGVAKSEATANEARKNASIALDATMRMEAQLKEKGLYTPTH